MSTLRDFLNHVQGLLSGTKELHGTRLHVNAAANPAQLLTANPSAPQTIVGQPLKGVTPSGVGTPTAAGAYLPLDANGKVLLSAMPDGIGGGGANAVVTNPTGVQVIEDHALFGVQAAGLGTPAAENAVLVLDADGLVPAAATRPITFPQDVNQTALLLAYMGG